MAYWLLKSEPNDYSIDDLESDGQTVWDGVKNNLALKHLRQMKKGDRAILYHTGKEKAAVGTCSVLSGPYPDPEGDDERWAVVDVGRPRRFKRPVTLAEVKADPFFADFPLVRMPRLSVMPVPKEVWQRIESMSRAT